MALIRVASFLWILTLLGTLHSAAKTIDFKQRKPSNTKLEKDSSYPGLRLATPHHAHAPSKGPATRRQVTDIENVMDVRYTVDAKLNGRDVILALDTGSTDIWAHQILVELGDIENTGIPLELLYGDGSYGVTGFIAFAPFALGEASVPSQAFLAAADLTVGGIAELGLDGLLGLGFELGRASPISVALRNQLGADNTQGRSFLGHLFAQDPTQPNFIALDLSRSDDLEETTGGSFAIGEYVEPWTSIRDAPRLPQFPPNAVRWTTLLEGITVDGESLPLRSTVSGTPSGHMVALLDTGDPTAVMPAPLVDAIYSQIPGAVPLIQDGERIWIVPCNTTSSVSLQFGGQAFPIHPLDLSGFSRPISIRGDQYTACIGVINAYEEGWGGNEMELSLGDLFLRNVYSLYDFGDEQPNGSIGEPYMQLLTQTDPAEAARQVSTIRRRTMASLPPELPPAELVTMLTGLVPNNTSPTGPRSPLPSLGGGGGPQSDDEDDDDDDVGTVDSGSTGMGCGKAALAIAAGLVAGLQLFV